MKLCLFKMNGKEETMNMKPLSICRGELIDRDIHRMNYQRTANERFKVSKIIFVFVLKFIVIAHGDIYQSTISLEWTLLHNVRQAYYEKIGCFISCKRTSNM